MKIAFVCGCLEPGRDGVGDYSRTLAEALKKRGHQVALLAVNDQYVAVPTNEEKPIATLRMPPGAFDAKRLSACQEWLEGFTPDWISLQFVPFMVDKRGLPWRFGEWFSSLAPNAFSHIFFHELWVGHSGRARTKALSFMQRVLIWRMLAKIQPALVQTSLDVAVDDLASIGCSASKLPLFSGIGVADRRGVRAKQLVFFGSLPAVRGPLTDSIAAYAEQTSEPFDVLLIGGHDDDRSVFARELNARLAPVGCRSINLGRLLPQEVSDALLTSSAGYSRNAGYNMGKSSSTLSMLEHGLPVWAPSWDGGVVDVPFRKELFSNALSVAMEMNPMEPHGTEDQVAQRFENALGQVGRARKSKDRSRATG